MEITKSKIIGGVVGFLALLVSFVVIPKMYEDVDAGEIVVIQDPFDGTLHVYSQPGWQWQGFGRATHYRKSNQFEFIAPKDKDEPNNSIAVKWNDGGHAEISGSVRYELPTDSKSIIRLHSMFGSQEAIESKLIKTNIEKAVYMTGPLMTSKESYAEKRNDLIYYIEDQASRGVYKTRQMEVKEIDALTQEEKLVTKVEIQHDTKGLPMRQEISPITLNSIKLYNISINGISYDANVEKQIQTQQQAIMNVQTAMANAKKAEQDVITISKQGEAEAAKAKWEQEVIKAKEVTQAEQRNKVAQLDVETAKLTKQKETLEGEGIAAKKRLVMQADGALDQKLEAYKVVSKYWADAVASYPGNWVPQIIMGGGDNKGNNNAAMNMMEMLSIKAASDLGLDMRNNKK